MSFIVFLLVILSGTKAWTGFGPGEQYWGYVKVRPHCQMFWWLYHTSATRNYTDRPLLVWLQGGPGSSASGSGNLKLSGPVDQELNEREYSWVKKANMLYVDSPVGAGYSYVNVTAGGTFSTNVNQAANDFVKLLKEFLTLHPEFQTVPIYLMGESWGGKFGAEFGAATHKAIVRGNLDAILGGVALAYPVVDIVSNVKETADKLYQTGIIDGPGKETFETMIRNMLIQEGLGNSAAAVSIYDQILGLALGAYKVAFYNVVDIQTEPRFSMPSEVFMDTVLAPILNVTWPFESQRNALKDSIWGVILKPSTKSVEYLLNHSNCKVVIYTGDLDWVVNVGGSYNWAKNMNWYGKTQWNAANREVFYVNDIQEGHEQGFGRFRFYWFKRSGHRLPFHNPGAANYMLQKLIGF